MALYRRLTYAAQAQAARMQLRRTTANDRDRHRTDLQSLSLRSSEARVTPTRPHSLTARSGAATARSGAPAGAPPPVSPGTPSGRGSNPGAEYRDPADLLLAPELLRPSALRGEGSWSSVLSSSPSRDAAVERAARDTRAEFRRLGWQVVSWDEGRGESVMGVVGWQVVGGWCVG